MRESVWHDDSGLLNRGNIPTALRLSAIGNAVCIDNVRTSR